MAYCQGSFDGRVEDIRVAIKGHQNGSCWGLLQGLIFRAYSKGE